MRDRERKVRQALRDESHRKDDLVTYLAHDLRTPLASVVGYLSLLQEAPELPVEQRAHFTGVALDKAHRLDALIEGVLRYHALLTSTISCSRAAMLIWGCCWLRWLTSSIPSSTSSIRKSKLIFARDLTVLVDGDKMARVFNNIMRNAVAYSYEGLDYHD